LFDFLAKRKNSSFPERKPTVSASGKKDFPDGNYLEHASPFDNPVDPASPHQAS